jgi:integrase
MNLADVKVYNFQQEQKEVVSYVTHSEVATLKQVIRDKVQGDIARGYQNPDRNALWLIDLIDWQRWSGMRISETLSLTPRSFNTETWDITIGSATFTTKSKRKQVLPIGRVKPLRELAERLLNECATIDTPLFGHSDSKRTSRTFKKYVRLALPEREDIHLHSLRHTCCIELLRNGVPIYTVQRWMRHSSVQTTQNYADLLNSDVGEQVGKAFIQFIP